jgi:hypothetical protein
MRHRIENSRPSGIRNRFRKKRVKRTGRRLLLESLEDRRLLAVTELAPEADAPVTASGPTSNFGAYPSLYAYGGYVESYLRFNLAGIGGSVTNATLVLQPNYVSGGGNGVLHLANDNWDEFAITWNNQPGYDAEPIASWTAVSNTQLSIDVTNTVQSQTGDGAVSFYLSDAGSSNYVIFDSKESVSTQYHPRLVVETSGGSTNRAPVAVNDSRSVNEDTDLTINVLANDSDPDGDAISL